VRLFVALEPPAAARERLWEWTVQTVGDDPALRPVAPEALHVTLAFLGERPDAEAATEVVSALEAPKLSLWTAGVLWLARVLSLAVADDPALTALHLRLCDALEVDDAPRPFRPHVTLARLRGRREPRSRSLPPAPRVDLGPPEVVLLRSHLGGEAGRPAWYEELARAQV
jgi:RNA 2',3'-cyclic 3'-phosphodiesterase